MRSFAAVGGDLRRGDAQMRGARAASSWQDTQKIFCVGCQLLAGNETSLPEAFLERNSIQSSQTLTSFEVSIETWHP